MHPEITVFAPGSVGNVGPGLDILGLATAGAGDTVTLVRHDTPGVTVVEPGDPALPRDPSRHASAIAANEVFARAGVSWGAALSLRKGLPLSGGQGGSAASAIAGAVAANHLASANLDATAILACALVAESRVAGRHADNLAPSLLGGLLLIRSLDPITVVRLDTPDALRIVLVRPNQQLETRRARGVLPPQVSREVALAQASAVAAMVAAALRGDIEGFGRAIDDQIAEPARAPLLPGFIAAKRAALDAGAFGCSISGAGPTAFAVTDDTDRGEAILAAMIAGYRREGIDATGRVAAVDREGARVL